MADAPGKAMHRLALLPAQAEALAELAREARYRGFQVVADPLGADVLVALLPALQAADWQVARGLAVRHWIGVGAEDDLDLRLHALHAGMTAYFPGAQGIGDILELAAGEVSAVPEEAAYEVLVVDDDASVANYHAAVLRSAGMRARVVTAAGQVWPALAERLPDVILLDLHMPQASGAEIASLLERDARYAHVPVVFVSAEEDVARQQQALRRGGVDFLVKPVVLERMMAVARQQARRFRQLGDIHRAWQQARREAAMEQRALDAHAVVSATDIDGNITYVNGRFCEISGYAAEELIGRNHRLLKSGAHAATFYADIWRTIAAGRVWQGEICNRARDGRLYWVQSTIVPFLDARGRPYRYLSVRTDITRVKTMVQELAQAKEGAEAANRAKSDFLARMSHELRTPLNAILGFAQLLELDANPALSGDQHENVRLILRAGWHLLELVNEVLDLSRIEAGGMSLSIEDVDVLALVQECLEIARPLAERRHVRVSAGAPSAQAVWLRADRTRLRQVLLNLMSNGIKYNREGGELSVGIDSGPDGVAVTVSDTGRGLSAEHQERLFEPFVRLDESAATEGTGIGLTITKSLVEMMQGRIEVRSEPGVGSTFTVRLPAGREQSVIDEGPAPSLPAGTAAMRILYVEDNLPNQELVKRTMREISGVSLTLACSGPEGVEKTITERPDLILLDLHLPGFDGYTVKELLNELEETMHIPVVALSADAQEASRERARSLGMLDYLTKPVDLERVREVVERFRPRRAARHA